MRTWAGWALSVLGVLVAVLGAALMVVLGPDSRFTTGPHAIETDDVAVVTAPDVIRWADVQVDVLAEVPVRKPIFIGVGNAVDVQDFVSTTQRLEITSFKRPWSIDSREVGGEPNLPGAPTALDWWIESSAGLGGASISTQLPDETVSIAIVSVGSSNLAGLEITLAYGVKGGFGKGAALLFVGLAVVVVGQLVRRGRRDDDDPDELDADEPIEEVVYVYVDENGVEREITEQEAGELEEVEVVEVEVVEDVPGIAPVRPPQRVAGIMTAGDIAASEPSPDPEPAESSEPSVTDERVVYVYVDDDGVEHEVGEDELDEFEIVDEEDRP